MALATSVPLEGMDSSMSSSLERKAKRQRSASAAEKRRIHNDVDVSSSIELPTSVLADVMECEY